MPISALRVNDFRNLTDVALSPLPSGLNIFCGQNGSGKTSLLEAIYYLGNGRSFRTTQSANLIQHQRDKFSLYIQMINAAKYESAIGAERYKQGLARFKINESESVSLAELAAYLPIRLIDAQSHQLLEAGPAFRRKYLDWGLFYQNSSFFRCWRQYERVLKQRNAVLQARGSKRELDPWTEELVQFGTLLDKLRTAYISELTPILHETLNQMTILPEVSLQYQSGWDGSRTFAEDLTLAYGDEMRLGYTQCGPHRADLLVSINGLPVKHFLSRGQQKLLIYGMILAQGKLLAQYATHQLIYLVDDLPAELDSVSRQTLLMLLIQQQSQVFVTAIEPKLLCELSTDAERPAKVFHVEHGCIKEMNP